ncbi:MAG TPA: PAS domain S-box protein, partial [Myxococcaceae bacterium]
MSLHEERALPSVVESALRLGEERLRKTLEYAHAGVFEWDIVTDEVFWSPENFELYGLALSETPSYDLWRSRVHPADRDRTERAVHDAVSGFTPECEVEFRVLRPEGGVRWVYSRGEVRRSVDGRPLHMRGLNIDITRRKEIELQLQSNQASLRQSEARFRALVSSVKDYAIFMLDPAGRIETWNAGAQQIKGYNADEIIGEHLSRFYTPEDLDRGLPATLLAQATRDGRVESEGWRIRKDGSRFWADVVITRLLDDRGQLMGFAKVTRDATARKKAELELREADRRNRDFVAVLSHELRNPLAPIRNSLVLLERTAPGTVAHLRARDVLVRQTEQLSRLVDDLVDIGRLTHGKIVLNPTRLDAGKVVCASCDALRPVFEDRGVVLELEKSPEPSWVEADGERLGQMVGNLLNNALKFTPPGGLVNVRVAPVGSRCEIHVRDTGAGIPPADLDRIFEPFVQGARAAASHGGMGVGLSLVKELASRQGGSVHVSSEGHGKGAEFVIALPRTSPADVRIPQQSQHARLQPLQVFLVEDNEDSARSLADLLELDGHTVEIFSEPAAALEVLPKRQPALLICDIGLPGMTGYDFIRTVRQAE